MPGREEVCRKIVPTLTLDRFVSTWEFLSLLNRHRKSRETLGKSFGITPYEPSKLYNVLDTMVALEESEQMQVFSNWKSALHSPGFLFTRENSFYDE